MMLACSEMWHHTLPCIPCFPSVWTRGLPCLASIDGPVHDQKKQDATSHSSPRGPRILELGLSLQKAIFQYLPCDAEAKLGVAARSFRLQGLSSQWPFRWRGGETLVTGENGWLVQFGEFDQISSQVNRLWWALELSELNGLLAIGLSDLRMPDNIFVGAPSKGKWMSWGWEITKKGALEAVDSLREELKPRSLTVDLRPSSNRTVVLFLLLDLRRSVLELYVRTCCASARNRICFLDRIPLSGLGDRIENISLLRPAACVDIGACVRLLEEADIADMSSLNGWT